MASEYSSRPVFLIGRHRSGTTMFWNIFRGIPGTYCLYEPFNARLDDALHSPDLLVQDSTHVGVKDYWKEYRALDQDRLLSLWSIGPTNSNIYLPPRADDKSLLNYVRYLYEESQARGRPVIKFVMADFRSEWLRKNFPDAIVVHVRRDARYVWESMMKGIGSDNVEDTQSLVNGTFFEHIQIILQSLQINIPGHHYCKFYLIWYLSNIHIGKVADRTWQYDDAIRSPGEWLKSQLDIFGLEDTKTIEDSIQKRVTPINTSYHDPGWYDQQEQFVEAWLDERFSKSISWLRLVEGIAQAKGAIKDGFPFRKIKRYLKSR